MICYKDMTFCPFHEECKLGVMCPRRYSTDVQEKVKESGMCVSLFADKPNCFESKNPVSDSPQEP